MRKFILSTVISLPLLLQAQTEKVDVGMMQKIKNEGINHSKVMDIAYHLTDANGNRLTNSAGFFRAANYVKQTLNEWGLKNVAIDPWGEFGKGWDLEKSYLAITAPYYKPLTAYPKAWCGGTKGLKTANVLVIDAKDSADLEKYKGQLKGKILILDVPVAYKLSFKPDASRYTDEELNTMEAAKPAVGRGGFQPPNPNDTAAVRRFRENMQRRGGNNRTITLLKKMAEEEGAIAILSTGPKNHDGTLFTQGGGGYKAADPENFLDMVLGIEDYNTILRLAKAGTPVKFDIDVKTKFQTKDLNGYNVIGEIAGTDPLLKDEVVMIGGHLDSWHTGTGATDNAAGSAVMMEAIRIIKTLGIQPRRTIRIGLWSGEEEGLLGSRGYVKKTFGYADTTQANGYKLFPAHEKFSTYFNIDNGTGKIRGIYLQGNEACRDIFKQWFEPLKDLTNGTVTISNTGGTDHQSFDGIGLPGFQFIQDEMEYNNRTHHSNMDVYDHLSEDDLKQIATIVAAFVYDAAQRDTKLPRKKLEKPVRGARMF
ncbi:MAG: M20/M25/M40 family metallo-hydrolase [Bacteroidetes bacterium]|nr:M20/M25/M40 family metallo-hydrolase [Bacteroidota bacterium]MBS1649709.1 M20/M25/M40 family metallo-hydrolase [Bacteroidota bacterium]